MIWDLPKLVNTRHLLLEDLVRVILVADLPHLLDSLRSIRVLDDVLIRAAIINVQERILGSVLLDLNLDLLMSSASSIESNAVKVGSTGRVLEVDVVPDVRSVFGGDGESVLGAGVAEETLADGLEGEGGVAVGVLVKVGLRDGVEICVVGNLVQRSIPLGLVASDVKEMSLVVVVGCSEFLGKLPVGREADGALNGGEVEERLEAGWVDYWSSVKENNAGNGIIVAGNKRATEERDLDGSVEVLLLLILPLVEGSKDLVHVLGEDSEKTTKNLRMRNSLNIEPRNKSKVVVTT